MRRRPVSRRLLLATALFVLTVAVFFPAIRCGFVSYDDPLYVTDAPGVREGLGLAAIRQAFGGTQVGNWHPLTTLSLAADVSLAGLRPAAFHLHNVLLHALAAALLLVALARLTGALWPSAAAAALFALHPLRVESVVWVSARKDVLSGVLFMLALLAWERYGRKPSARGMALTVLAAVGGLMAKPTLVVLPALLLILDFWPLARNAGESSSARRAVALLREKWPLLGVSLAFSVVVLIAQRSAGAVASVDFVPVQVRLANVPVAALAYLGDLVWPARLAVLYPLHPPGAGLVVGSTLALVVASILVILWRRSAPWLAAGWTWYLTGLVPVIGLIQVGSQARADRYTYLPQIGIAFALAWGASALVQRFQAARRPVVVLWGGALLVLALVTRQQIGVWRDSVTLWQHTIACTDRNIVAQVNLGKALLATGRNDEGIAHLREALAIDPDHPDAANDLAVQLYLRGQYDTALPFLEAALRRRPADPVILANTGLVQALRGRWDAAAAAFTESLRLRPDDADALTGLGVAELELSRLDEAEHSLARATEVNPGAVLAWVHVGRVRAARGDCQAAVSSWQRALALNGREPLALRHLAWMLATSPDARCRDGVHAVALARELAALGVPGSSEVLAAALAEAGRASEAVTVQEQVVAAAPAGPRRDQAIACLERYRRGEALRDAGKTDPRTQRVR
ncbi:MAG: tetratricopeptide repeat protein [Thermoanaerobaculaceae bacterium]|nr:tetratricopeptide repeat protein [Thermoanaerobaculaceae bacterium]